MSGAPPIAPGEAALDGYEVIEHLSRGRRLDVYDAWSAERGCRVVLKMIRPERAGEEKARASLLEEGRLLGTLGHPHLVRAYEVVVEPVPAIVLETLSGQTVAHLIGEGPALSGAEIAHLGLHLGSAMGYLHTKGVLHLDLKPANVVAEAGRARVIDLSVALPPGPAEAGVGTPDYMAPEQARGGELTAAADVWGIGLVMLEAVLREQVFAMEYEGEEGDDEGGSETWASATGTEGFTDDELGPGDYLQLSERAPRLAGSGRVDEPLAALIDACLEPHPGDRPALGELLAGLEPCAGLPEPERRFGRQPWLRR